MFTASSPGIPSFGDLTWHKPVRLATVVGLPAHSYTGATFPATMTASANGALGSIDGVAVALGDRLLVRAETNGRDNGIYVVNALGDATHPWIMQRALDAATAAEVAQGSVTFVSAGTLCAGRMFQQTAVIANIDVTTEVWPLYGAAARQAVNVNAINGSTTYTPPTSPAFLGILIEAVGAGGGSGGVAATGVGQVATASGGGGGGYARKWLPASAMGGTYPVTVGKGGTAGAAGNNAGGTGGVTSMTGTGLVGGGIQCVGGTGGGGCAAFTGPGLNSTGGAGGAASGGDINTTGDDGGHGFAVSATEHRTGGYGGGSVLGGQTERDVTSAGGSGNPGAGYGCGGSGAHNPASTAARAGSIGADGLVVITEFYSA